MVVFVQGLICNPIGWGYMGKKVNVYLDDNTLELWKIIPSGERSAVIKRAIQDAAAMQPEDERVAKLQKLRMKKENLEMERLVIQDRMAELESSIEDLLGDFVQEEFNGSEEFEVLKEYARCLHADQTIASYSGRSHYLIAEVSEDYIMIRNQNSGKEAKITRSEFEQSLMMLIAGGGKIAQHSFIPYKMKEYAVVALHPRLVPRYGAIEWMDEYTVPVNSAMVPENRGTNPPEDWVSDKHHLAVMIDGRRAHISVGGRDKICVFMMDGHPLIGNESDEMPLFTKYWMIQNPGQFFWGHNGYIHSIIIHPKWESDEDD
tara:strand:+ start:780 stop:1733 length:954 start_codon:yes stop_codon:yes gene_type:complete